jgi:general secretion pathway protein K
MSHRTAKSFLFRHRSKKRGEHGIALISVLWLIAVLGVLAAAAIALAKTDYRDAQAARDRAEAAAAADGAVFLIIGRLCDVHKLSEVRIDGQKQTIALAQHQVEVSVQDELGKIDLNFAPRDLLKALLLSVGLAQDQAATVTNAIDAKRASVFSRTANEWAAGDTDISTAIFPFLTVGELKAIPGIDDDLYNGIAPALTVYSQQASPQVSTSPVEVLRALPGMNQSQINSVLAARASQPVTAASIGATESIATSGSILAGRSFTIEAAARVGAAMFIRRAVVLITGEARTPYRVLDWEIGATPAS